MMILSIGTGPLLYNGLAGDDVGSEGMVSVL